MKAIDKALLVKKLREIVQSEIETLRQAAASAREGATHEEAKPEDDKDTRALEQSYLAGAQAGRARVLEAADKRLEFLDIRDRKEDSAVAPGTLVVVEMDGVRANYFVADAAGGTKVTLDGVEIQVLTAEAPLGQALIGHRKGDVVERTVKGETREYEILSVR